MIIKVDEPTEWVSSLVVVEKPDGSIRLCLDPRDLNKVVKREHYQLPTFEEIATRLSGAHYFSKLDANKGYWQIPLDEASSKLTVFSTPFAPSSIEEEYVFVSVTLTNPPQRNHVPSW